MEQYRKKESDSATSTNPNFLSSITPASASSVPMARISMMPSMTPDASAPEETKTLSEAIAEQIETTRRTIASRVSAYNSAINRTNTSLATEASVFDDSLPKGIHPVHPEINPTDHKYLLATIDSYSEDVDFSAIVSHYEEAVEKMLKRVVDSIRSDGTDYLLQSPDQCGEQSLSDMKSLFEILSYAESLSGRLENISGEYQIYKEDEESVVGAGMGRDGKTPDPRRVDLSIDLRHILEDINNPKQMDEVAKNTLAMTKKLLRYMQEIGEEGLGKLEKMEFGKGNGFDHMNEMLKMLNAFIWDYEMLIASHHGIMSLPTEG